LLLGDSGSGKSYLLGRVKRTLNPKAFFAYIGPWADSEHIWRHVLRYTVDSLMQVPEGQQDSQLMLWLKSLSAFTKRNVKQRIAEDNFWEIFQTDRKKFIKHLKQTYKSASIYNPDIFFGVLHDLTNPELYDLACEWLRGDDLSDESMQELKVKHCIDSEDAAKTILSNFGRISTETQPIVLCFDNLDNIPTLPDGSQDFPALFNINTTIHNDYLKNFLVIISVITDTWRRNGERIQQGDRARIDKPVLLKRINLEQAEALWSYHLNSLHQQANPLPDSPIFPLNSDILEQNFPGGKTTPRNTINQGKIEYQKYKLSLLEAKKPDVKPTPVIYKHTLPKVDIKQPTPDKKNPVIPPPLPLKNINQTPQLPTPTPQHQKDKSQAEFELLWQQEYKKTQVKITKITLLSASELMQIIQEVLQALQIQGIKPKIISGKYANHSLSYQQLGKGEIVGLIWTEEANMNTFYNIMNACQKAIQENLCQKLYLIRAGGVGKPNLKGNQLYRQIFTNTQHHHIQPNLSSVHKLATYHSFVNSTLAQELFVAGKAINLKELQTFIRQSKLLEDCRLLQDLGIFTPASSGSGTSGSNTSKPEKTEWQPVKDFLLNLVITQHYIGRNYLVENAHRQFPELHEEEIEKLINLLWVEKKINIANPKANREDQTVCLVV